MKNKAELIDLFITNKVLQFGDFTLKSGIKSNYFFNLGNVIGNVKAINLIADYLAEFIVKNKLKPKIIFGPAYKGIPLALATCLKLEQKGINIYFCFDRKETKNHGEGGNFIGKQSNKSEILLIDDVLTKGTALKNSISKINSAKEFKGSKLHHILVILDRCEKNKQGKTISLELEQKLNLKINSILNLKDIIYYLENNPGIASQKQILILKNQNDNNRIN